MKIDRRHVLIHLGKSQWRKFAAQSRLATGFNASDGVSGVYRYRFEISHGKKAKRLPNLSYAFHRLFVLPIMLFYSLD